MTRGWSGPIGRPVVAGWWTSWIESCGEFAARWVIESDIKSSLCGKRQAVVAIQREGVTGMRSRYFQAAAAFAVALVLALPVAAQQAATTGKLRDPDVIYVPTPQEVVDAMLTMANVT